MFEEAVLTSTVVYGGNLQVGSFEGYEDGLVFKFQTFQLPVEEEGVGV